MQDRPNVARPDAESEPKLVNPRRVTVGAAPSAGEFGDIGQYLARRLLALLTDLIAVTALLAVAIDYVLAQGGLYASSRDAFLTMLGFTGSALIVYLCLAEAYPGTTLGKALFGLRVQAVDGGRVGIGRAIARNLFLPFDLLVVGFLLAAISPRHKRLGDFVAGTEVVNLRTGPLAPILAAALLGGWAYLDYALADGLQTVQSLGGDIERYGPSLVAGQGTPAPGPTPLPARTPVPTEEPITVPTIVPSEAASPEASPQPSATSGAEASPSASVLPTPQPPTTT